MSENPVSRDSQRVPLETRVQLKFEWFGGFISEYSANISPGGMFIRTQTPEPVGRLIGFELRLGDGYELIRGTGEVVWARVIDQGPDKQAGMGIRFLEISPDGRELIYQMVDNYIAQGGTPFDVTDMPGPSPAPGGGSAPVAPVDPPADPAGPEAVAPFRPSPAGGADRVLPSSLEPSPDWLPALASPGLVSPPAKPSASVHPAIPEALEVPDEEAPARRGSRLVRWSVVGGGLVLLAALGVFKQDTLLGWFLPAKGAAADAGPALVLPRHQKASTPAASGGSGASGAGGAPATLGASMTSAAPATSATSATSTTSAAPAGAAAPQESLASSALRSAVPAGSPDPAPTAAPKEPPPPTPATVSQAAPRSTPPSPPPPPQPVAALPSAVPAPAPVPTGVGPGEIEKITWKQEPDGTEVILWADGAIRRQDWAHYRIDGDPPRELIKLYGIRHPFPSARLVAGTRQLLQVRTGYHVESKGNELHVVLDLSGFGVEVTGIEAQGGQLHVHLKGK